MTDVTRTTIPEMVIAGLRKIVPTYHDEGTLWEEIMPALTEAGVSFPAEGLAGATFHDREYQETDTDIEVWVQVSEPFNAKAPLTCRVEPTQEVVTARLLGDYSQMPAVTTAIGEYLAEHQVTTGSMFNIYRVSPAQNPDPSSWVTDVCFPIADE